jgi:methionyl-tRNA formyltransferase
MQPDLCITAAYGNMLPTRFLEIPRCGTLNIHPSLLPQFRGAAPVPRAIEVRWLHCQLAIYHLS